MLPRVIVLIAAFAFLNSPTSSAQSKEHSSDDLLARVSYSSTLFAGCERQSFATDLFRSVPRRVLPHSRENKEHTGRR